MDKELLIKARQASSVEEILRLAKENNIDLTENQAKEYFSRLQSPSCELSDDELDAVAGGGCEISVNGKKKVRVTRGCRCFTGQFESISGGFGYDAPISGLRTDIEFEPRPDGFLTFSAEGACGMCIHCGFYNGYAYCKKT